jgi:hypothetical protein
MFLTSPTYLFDTLYMYLYWYTGIIMWHIFIMCRPDIWTRVYWAEGVLQQNLQHHDLLRLQREAGSRASSPPLPIFGRCLPWENVIFLLGKRKLQIKPRSFSGGEVSLAERQCCRVGSVSFAGSVFVFSILDLDPDPTHNRYFFCFNNFWELLTNTDPAGTETPDAPNTNTNGTVVMYHTGEMKLSL